MRYIKLPRYLSIKARLYSVHASLFGKVPFTDKYGLRYYLWNDTRLTSTIAQGVRTDDTGVMVQVFQILDALAETKKEIICFDVGAFIGVITLAMASKLQGVGKVFAFEPSTKNFARLVENIQLNRYPNVFPQHVAISESVDEAVLTLTEEPGKCFLVAKSEFSGDSAGEDEFAYENVRTDTVSQFAERNAIESIDLLKIDAEFADDRVIAGSHRLLETGSISYVIFEVNAGCEYSQDALDLMDSHGYESFFIVRNGKQLVRDLNNYPMDTHKPPLNALAISPNAPAFPGGEGLDVIE